jgi:hypothetical protein
VRPADPVLFKTSADETKRPGRVASRREWSTVIRSGV